MTPLRIAMLSAWHVHARDYARQARDNPATEIVAVWDELPERGRAFAAEWGGRFHENLDAILGGPDVDAVVVDTPTDRHHAVLVRAAEAGKHVFTEKVLAPTLRECNAILAAVERAGVRLAVSLPRLSWGRIVAVRQAVEAGRLGQLTQVRCRLSHDGALATDQNPHGWLPAHFYDPVQTAGGAMIDLGCHPMYIARLLLGLPETVSARYGFVTGRGVEDNAVALLGYPDGAVGIVEAGFVNPRSPFTLEAHGTHGSLLLGPPDERPLIRVRGGDWTPLEVGPDLATPFDRWAAAVAPGADGPAADDLADNVATAVDLTRLMEAANLSARAGAEVRLDSLAG